MCVHPDMHEYIKKNPNKMTLGMRIIREDVLPCPLILLNEQYFFRLEKIEPGDKFRTIRLVIEHNETHEFRFNIVNLGDKYDFESQFMMNCCV